MTVSDWATAAAVLTALVVLGLTALDRSRLKQRLDNAEGVITGLTLDLDATQARVAQLQSYLVQPASWDVDASTPSALADARPADRWSADTTSDAASTAGDRADGSDAASASAPTGSDESPSRRSERQT